MLVQQTKGSSSVPLCFRAVVGCSASSCRDIILTGSHSSSRVAKPKGFLDGVIHYNQL